MRKSNIYKKQQGDSQSLINRDSGNIHIGQIIESREE